MGFHSAVLLQRLPFSGVECRISFTPHLNFDRQLTILNIEREPDGIESSHSERSLGRHDSPVVCLILFD
jgi:hypothetical protein